MRAHSLPDREVEHALQTGRYAGVLESYFGEPEYLELRELAREAQAQGARGGPRVLLLPGIMGSKIGVRGRPCDDVIWLDPYDVAHGKLARLALDGASSRFVALGVLLFTYLKLKLHLRIAGYDVDFHPFDWRKSLEQLGSELAERIAREPAAKVNLVAHSMGGLVCRAAIAQGAAKVDRLVMLGTPNFGSFAVPQALRATHAIARKIGALDLEHSPEDLAEHVFSTFPGLCEMLPFPEKFGHVDLFDLDQWPSAGPRPRREVLAGAREVQLRLAKADHRFFLIAGVNQETVTHLSREGDDFVYETSLEGDGLVPLALARLPGATTYYVEETHGSLPNNTRVARAVADLLAKEPPSALPDTWLPARRGRVRTVRDGELRVAAFGGRAGTDLRQKEVRLLLEEVASPTSHEALLAGVEVPLGAYPAPPGEASGFQHVFDHLVVGRRRQHRIDIRLAFGNITDVDTRAYVLGIYQDVIPGGPARRIDSLMDGVISEFNDRRMFGGSTGQVFILPTGRNGLRAEMLLLAGLGPFDRFDDEVAQLVAENVVRTLARTNIDDFATLMVGAGSGRSISSSLRNQLIGYLRGLHDVGRKDRVQCIALCESSRERYEEMKGELLRLASTPLCSDVELSIEELPARPRTELVTSRELAPRNDPTYLIVRRDGARDGTLEIRSSVLGSGAKATVITGTKSVDARELDALLARLGPRRLGPESLPSFGDELARMVLADDIRAVLESAREQPLVVVQDAPTSRIPWETIRIGDRFPAAMAGLSRRYAAENLSVAKWLEERRRGPTLEILLISNPTEDLDGADREAERVVELFRSNPGVNVHHLARERATKPALLAAFRSGAYDVVHYAGHAFFDPSVVSGSGILCHGGDVLTGKDLAGLGALPTLVFFNACESGRIRGTKRKNGERDVRERLEENVGFAESFLRAGVANYLGTYWPVGDDAADRFADVFYGAALEGRAIGDAVVAGRAAVEDLQSVDWADYILYGNHEFTLKSAAP